VSYTRQYFFSLIYDKLFVLPGILRMYNIVSVCLCPL